MTVKYLFFYATPNDIILVLRRLEANAPVKFIEDGIRPSPNHPIFLSSSELPNAGIAQWPSAIACPTYLVSHRDTKNYLHEFAANDGNRLWELCNGDNDETVLLNLGGVTKSGALLEGQMTTLHGTRTAQQIMRWFLSALKRQNFVRIQGSWVGPEALAMLKEGKRLTQAPLDADLKCRGQPNRETEKKQGGGRAPQTSAGRSRASLAERALRPRR